MKHKKKLAFLLGTAGILGMTGLVSAQMIPKLLAGDLVVNDLKVTSTTQGNKIRLKVQDDHSEDTKVVIPLPAGVTYQPTENVSTGITEDKTNHQLSIDWLAGEIKQAEVELEASESGTYDFSAQTVREDQAVSSEAAQVTVGEGSGTSASSTTTASSSMSTDPTSSALTDPTPSPSSSDTPKSTSDASSSATTTQKSQPSIPNEIGLFSTTATDEATKVVTGPVTPMYLMADKVTFENEFTGDTLHFGGQEQKDTVNLRADFQLTDNLPDNTAIAAANSPSEKYIFSQTKSFAINMALDPGRQKVDPFWFDKLVDLENSTAKVVINGVDMSQDFKFFETAGANASTGISLAYTGAEQLIRVDSGIHLEINLKWKDYVGTVVQPIPDIPYVNCFDIGIYQTHENLGSSKFTSDVSSLIGASPILDLNRNGTTPPLYFMWGYDPTLFGIEDKEIPIHSSFDPMEGVTATDPMDGELTSKITHTGEVNVNKAGVYPVVYSVTDINDHTTTVTRNITVTSIPTITAEDKTFVVGTDPSTVNWLEGVTANDPSDGDITKDVSLESQNVDFNTVGRYVATYKVTNSTEHTAHKSINVDVVPKAGVLQFVNVPSTMSFNETKISNRAVEVSRQDPAWKIKVEDSRATKNNWQVTAQLKSPFKNDAGQTADLLNYRQSGQSDQAITTADAVDVFDGQSTADTDYYDVSWGADAGPLLKVAPGTVKAGKYTGTIEWSLIDAPV